MNDARAGVFPLDTALKLFRAFSVFALLAHAPGV
jgi:hypothetical protein